ncbi:hypothetical protein [Aeromonas veronii]|uniref:hypothetical protein n=1 Tax=Aeromonas veronii TaxID=654 RepID=UPI003BA38A44
MQELLEAVKDWPVIVQGALGSALFSLIIFGGQAATKYITVKYSFHSKRSRYTWLVNRSAQLRANMAASDAEFSAYAIIMLYRASRYLFRALMWLSLGLLLEVFFQPAAVIGFAGCIYYLFKGYNVVGGLENTGDFPKQLEDTMKEIEDLDRNS